MSDIVQTLHAPPGHIHCTCRIHVLLRPIHWPSSLIQKEANVLVYVLGMVIKLLMSMAQYEDVNHIHQWLYATILDTLIDNFDKLMLAEYFTHSLASCIAACASSLLFIPIKLLFHWAYNCFFSSCMFCATRIYNNFLSTIFCYWWMVLWVVCMR